MKRLVLVFSILFILVSSCSKKDAERNHLATKNPEGNSLTNEDEIEFKTLATKNPEGNSLTNENKLKFKTLMADVFDENSPTYEFDIRNPLLKRKFYIENLDALKGRILLVRTYKYTLFANGARYYGDGNPLTTSYYLFFDEDGVVTDEYFLFAPDESGFTNCEHTKYSYSENKLHALTCEYYFSENGGGVSDYRESSVDYIFEKEDEDIVCYVSANEENKKYCRYTKKNDSGVCTFIETKFGYDYDANTKTDNIYIDYEYTYCMDKCVYEDYSVYGEPLLTRNIEKGVIENLRQDVFADYKFNDDNLLIYEIQRPLIDGDVGAYSEMNTYILDSPDETFVRYCPK